MIAKRGNGAPDGECAPYARQLQAKLTFPTKVIKWTVACNEPIPQCVRHEILSYQVGPEVWFIDNSSLGPKWVGTEGDSLEKMVQQWYAPNWVYVSNIRVDGKPN